MKRKCHNANKMRHTRSLATRAVSATGSPAKLVSPAPVKVPRKGGVDTVWHIAIVAFVITAGIFWIVWKWIDPAFASHVSLNSSLQDSTIGFPDFYLTSNFFRNELSQPGGLACYLSSLLCQTYSVSWLGSLLLSLEALVIWLGVYALLQRATSLRAVVGASKCEATPKSLRLPRLTFLACAVPSLLLLGTWTNGFPYPSATLSVILGIYSALLGSVVRPRNQWARLVILLILSMLVFMTGTSALLVFVPLGLFLEIMAGSGWSWAATFLSGGCLVPFAAGMLLYGLSPRESASLMIPAGLGDWDLNAARQMVHTFGLSDRMVMTSTLMKGVCLSAAVCGPICLAATRYAKRVRRIPLAAAWPAGTALLLGSVFGMVRATWNDSMHTFLAVDYYAAQQMWDQARSAAKGHERNAYISCVAAQAAYHTGDLVKELPVFQDPTDLLLAKRESLSSWRKSDLYFDLGYVNMSLHHSAEAMEMFGERPALIKRLALMNLALGNFSSGKIYLNCLSQIPFQSGWAKEYLAKLDVDPNLAADPEIQRLRKCRVRNDLVGQLPVDQEMMLLLLANRNNRMAFEYMITYYLLTRDLQNFLQQLPRINDFPGMTLSPLWQEALLMAVYSPTKQVDDPRVTPDVRNRFEELVRIVRESGTDQARARIGPKYANTYFFYYLFHE
jgi:hypothetical protein